MTSLLNDGTLEAGEQQARAELQTAQTGPEQVAATKAKASAAEAHVLGQGSKRRSVPMGAVVDQVRTLVDSGYAEIVLTGVDVTSYGADLPGRPRLGALARRLLADMIRREEEDPRFCLPPIPLADDAQVTMPFPMAAE